MWASVIALLGLIVRVLASDLTVEDAGATFKLIGAEGEDCATSLRYIPGSVSSNRFTLRSVQAGTEDCTSTPHIINGVDDAAIESGNYVTGGSIARAATQTKRSLLAIDKKARKCGDTNYAQGTVTAIIRPNQHITVAPGLQLPPGLWAVVANPNSSGLCLYAGEGTINSAVDEMNNATVSKTRTSHDSVCFPGTANVLLADGTYVDMARLVVGDMVQTGAEPSRVYMFTHREIDVPYRFLRLHTRLDTPLVLTAGHRLYANNALVAADQVRVGDYLRAVDGRALRVVKIDEVFGSGLYNPQTVQGDIVIDGVIVSTFTTAIESRSAHALLAPLRALYSCTRTSFTGLEGRNPISRWYRAFRRRP